MKIVAVQFDYPGNTKYDVLSRVLEHSVKKNCPSANFVLIKIPPPELKGLKRCFDSNTIKLKHWQDQLNCDDEQVVFMDCDMIVLKDIASAFDDLNYDIGITTRSSGNYLTHGRLPINGGVVFVRNNQAGKAWVKLFFDINQWMFENPLKHQPWRDRYGGMNQAAMGYIMEGKAGNYSARVKKFSCLHWNACMPEWQNITDETKIIHIKSGLRNTVLHQMNDAAFNVKYKSVLYQWRLLASEIGLIKKEDIELKTNIQLPSNQFTNYKNEKIYKPELVGGKVRWHNRSLTP